MTEIVTAVYEKGVLRPLHAINLQERQKVRLQVLPEESPADEVAAAIRILVEAGLMHSPPRGTPPSDPVSEKERLALAERLSRAQGKSLSEVVIEDRGKR
jgi:predicted DNA-binding antitoxin AbrB/MazE fold protein